MLSSVVVYFMHMQVMSATSGLWKKNSMKPHHLGYTYSHGEHNKNKRNDEQQQPDKKKVCCRLHNFIAISKGFMAEAIFGADKFNLLFIIGN